MSLLPAEPAPPGPPPAQTRSPVNPAELTHVDGSCSPFYLQNLQLVLRSFRLPTLDLRDLESTPTRPYGAVLFKALLNSQNIVLPLTTGVQTDGGKTCRGDTPESDSVTSDLCLT